MTRTATRLTATVLTLMLAGGAFAKGHDQGGTAEPGENVKEETVGPAHTLGAGRGNRPTALPPGQAKKAD